MRGTLKLYLGKYTTRDWRRKRFTDDIDFWIYDVPLWESVLKENGWIKNRKTKEWDKIVVWKNPFTHKRNELLLHTSNDLNQVLDFGGGSYLEGSNLRDIFAKKLKRGHDVDLSDIINVAMVFNKANGNLVDEWNSSWETFEEAANTRNKRITSNLISICRYSLAISDYFRKVGKALLKHHNSIFDMERYPNERIREISQISIHWSKYLKNHGYDVTRELIHNYIFEQGFFKKYYAKNLKDFALRVLNLLNSKYEFVKVVFEIEYD